MKRIDFNQRVRRTRKSEVKKLGQVRFGFYVDEELLKYKFFKGIKVRKKVWRRLENINFKGMPNSQYEWEKSIKKKYKSYSVKELKEFSDYLDYAISNEKSINSMNTIIGSVIGSSFFSAALTQLFSENIMFDGGRKGLVELLFLLIGILFIISFVIWIVFYLLNDLAINNKFFTDYKKVIDTMLDQKQKN